MEVGLWRTVFQCPVAFAAVGQFDDGTDAEQQRVIGRQQFPGDGCIQLETVRGAVQGNPWCCGGEKIRIAFPVIVETIACPLARWRKIEFLVFFRLTMATNTSQHVCCQRWSAGPAGCDDGRRMSSAFPWTRNDTSRPPTALPRAVMSMPSMALQGLAGWQLRVAWYARFKVSSGDDYGEQAVL